MALLDTINQIEQRRDRVLNRRQARMMNGEPVEAMPVSKEKLRQTMSYLDMLFKENRAKYAEQMDKQQRLAQAVQMMEQQNASTQQNAPQQPLMASPQQQGAPSGLLGMPR